MESSSKGKNNAKTLLIEGALAIALASSASALSGCGCPTYEDGIKEVEVQVDERKYDEARKKIEEYYKEMQGSCEKDRADAYHNVAINLLNTHMKRDTLTSMLSSLLTSPEDSVISVTDLEHWSAELESLWKMCSNNPSPPSPMTHVDYDTYKNRLNNRLTKIQTELTFKRLTSELQHLHPGKNPGLNEEVMKILSNTSLNKERCRPILDAYIQYLGKNPLVREQNGTLQLPSKLQELAQASRIEEDDITNYLRAYMRQDNVQKAWRVNLLSSKIPDDFDTYHDEAFLYISIFPDDLATTGRIAERIFSHHIKDIKETASEVFNYEEGNHVTVENVANAIDPYTAEITQIKEKKINIPLKSIHYEDFKKIINFMTTQLTSKNGYISKYHSDDLEGHKEDISEYLQPKIDEVETAYSSLKTSPEKNALKHLNQEFDKIAP